MAGKRKPNLISVIAVAGAAAVATSGIFIWKHQQSSQADGLAYVTSLKEINTAAGYGFQTYYSGVVESQEVTEVKVDSEKTLDQVFVSEGDSVKEGTPLFSYDVTAMQLQLDQGNLDIERMQNENTTTTQQIQQLEAEKQQASADDQLSYTTQIQSLQTDLAKNEYDIKVKQTEMTKLKNSIEHATVTATKSGTIKTIRTKEQMQADNTDVMLTILADGDFRVKGIANEQNIQTIYQEEPVVLKSRIDDSTWTGTISEINMEAENKQNNSMGYYSDEASTSSSYAFYIKLDTSDGLMLGQHVLITPAEGSTIEKSGIWLYADYVVDADTDQPYVWIAGKKDKLEKRYVTLGEQDAAMGDVEIADGLSGDEYLAYPAEDYQEGMRTTTSYEEYEKEQSDSNSDEMPADGEDIPFEAIDPDQSVSGELDPEFDVDPEESAEQDSSADAAPVDPES